VQFVIPAQPHHVIPAKARLRIVIPAKPGLEIVIPAKAGFEIVIPAKAGIQFLDICIAKLLVSRIRGNDGPSTQMDRNQRVEVLARIMSRALPRIAQVVSLCMSRAASPLFVILHALFCPSNLLSATEEVPESSIGLEARLDGIVLPGSLLEVKPIELETPVVVRIVHAFAHGTDHRYDLVYYGLEPGRHDLKDFLRRIDGSSTDDLPSIPIEILSTLPAGQVIPSPPPSLEVPGLGGYRLLLVVGGTVWLLGLAGFFFWRKQAGAESSTGDMQRPLTLEQRLRPLIDAAIQGDLSSKKRAELELALLNYWQRKLGLTELHSSAAWNKLRSHAEAGPFLLKLEEWLHRPSPRTLEDIEPWLRPYRDLEPGATEDHNVEEASSTSR